MTRLRLDQLACVVFVSLNDRVAEGVWPKLVQAWPDSGQMDTTIIHDAERMFLSKSVKEECALENVSNSDINRELSFAIV